MSPAGSWGFMPGVKHDLRMGPGSDVIVDGKAIGAGLSLNVSHPGISQASEIEITFVRPDGVQVRVRGHTTGPIRKNADGTFDTQVVVNEFHEDHSQAMAYGVDSIDVTTYGDQGKTFIMAPRGHGKSAYAAGVSISQQLQSLIGKTVDGLFLDEDGKLHMVDQKVTDDSPIEGARIEVDVDWGCCDEPRPVIHNATGRFFCANCRRWLDRGSASSGDSGATGDAPDPDASGTSVDQVAPAKARRSRRKQKE